MRVKDSARVRRVLLVGGFLGLFANYATASVNYKCNTPASDSVVCNIQGSLVDNNDNNIINQATIDGILKAGQTAKNLTIKLENANYLTYPIKISGRDNLTIYFEDGATFTAVSRKGNGQEKNPWKKVNSFITLESGNNITITGLNPEDKNQRGLNGRIIGNGPEWWENSPGKNGEDFPSLILVENVNGFNLEHMSLLDAGQGHVKIRKAQNIKINDINIMDDSTRSATDGINMGGVENVAVTNSIIVSGNDNIVVNSGAKLSNKNIRMENLYIYEGHGISLGSDIDQSMETITAKNIQFINTRNGFRIKASCERDCVKVKPDNLVAYQDGLGGKNPVEIKNVSFEDIFMDNVKYPINFDFHYNGYDKWSRVQVSNVKFNRVTASGSKEAASLVCDSVNKCSGISFNQVKIDSGAYCRNIEMTVDNVSKNYGDKTQKCL